jgi:hypothetical protein
MASLASLVVDLTAGLFCIIIGVNSVRIIIELTTQQINNFPQMLNRSLDAGCFFNDTLIWNNRIKNQRGNRKIIT